MWRLREVCLLFYLARESAGDLRTRSVSIRSSMIAGAAAAGMVFAGLLSTGKGMSMEEILPWLSGVVPGIALLGIAVLTRRALGCGDALAVLVTGLYLGGRGCVSVVSTAFFLTCPAALGLIVFKKAGRKTAMPFLPFLLAGYLVWLALI